MSSFFKLQRTECLLFNSSYCLVPLDQLHSPHVLQFNRGTQRIVSVNYLFGRPLIAYNFLKGIFTSIFRDMGNLRPSVFRLTKMLFWVPKKGQLRFSERK